MSRFMVEGVTDAVTRGSTWTVAAQVAVFGYRPFDRLHPILDKRRSCPHACMPCGRRRQALPSLLGGEGLFEAGSIMPAPDRKHRLK